MPYDVWTEQRERQDEQIRDGLEDRGRTEGGADITGRTYDQLRAEAARRGIPGRSKLNKAQLEEVLSR